MRPTNWLSVLRKAHGPLASSDVIFCDPDRRVSGRRQAASTAWSPDPVTWLKALRQQHPQARWLVKLGTAVDPVDWLADFPEASVLILGWRGECREVLIAQADHLQPGTITAWLINDYGRPKLALPRSPAVS